MEIREDLYDFVLNKLIEEGNTEEESLLMMSTINENWAQGMQNAAKMFKIMTGIDKLPIKPPSGPINLTNIFRGASTPSAPKPASFKIGTPPPGANQGSFGRFKDWVSGEIDTKTYFNRKGSAPAKPSLKVSPKSVLGGALLTGIVTKTADVLSKAANPKEWERTSAELKARQSKETPFQHYLKTRVKFDPIDPMPKPKAKATFDPIDPMPATPVEKSKVVEPVAAKPVERKRVVPPVARPAAKPADPEVQRYRDLIKQGRTAEAENLGKEIHAKTYGIPRVDTKKIA